MIAHALCCRLVVPCHLHDLFAAPPHHAEPRRLACGNLRHVAHRLDVICWLGSRYERFYCGSRGEPSVPLRTMGCSARRVVGKSSFPPLRVPPTDEREKRAQTMNISANLLLQYKHPFGPSCVFVHAWCASVMQSCESVIAEDKEAPCSTEDRGEERESSHDDDAVSEVASTGQQRKGEAQVGIPRCQVLRGVGCFGQSSKSLACNLDNSVPAQHVHDIAWETCSSI